MIGNEEQTEQLLKQTSEHGTILMSIDSLYRKIATNNEQNNQEIHFIWHKNLKEDAPNAKPENAFSPKSCIHQLDVIKAYIEGFDMFRDSLSDSIETDGTKGPQSKIKQTYFQRMTAALEAMPKYADQIDDFRQLDPSHVANR